MLSVFITLSDLWLACQGYSILGDQIS